LRLTTTEIQKKRENKKNQCRAVLKESDADSLTFQPVKWESKLLSKNMPSYKSHASYLEGCTVLNAWALFKHTQPINVIAFFLPFYNGLMEDY